MCLLQVWRRRCFGTLKTPAWLINDMKQLEFLLVMMAQFSLMRTQLPFSSLLLLRLVLFFSQHFKATERTWIHSDFPFICSHFSESDDAIVYGDFDTNFLQRAAIDIGLFEFGANYNGRCNCHNDWIIIRYGGTDLCTVSNIGIFHSKYHVKKGSKRYRHSSFTITACARTVGIVSISPDMALYGLLQNSTRTNNCKCHIVLLLIVYCWNTNNWLLLLLCLL